jgi:hypothetical protein
VFVCVQFSEIKYIPILVIPLQNYLFQTETLYPLNNITPHSSSNKVTLIIIHIKKLLSRGHIVVLGGEI